MPHYLQQGEIPPKRHTRFTGPGGALRFEQLVSRRGFADIYSNLYHLRMPTRIRKVGTRTWALPKPAAPKHRHRHLRTGILESSGDAVTGRRVLFYNRDVRISKVHPEHSMEVFYRNGHHDELLFVQEGAGVLTTQLGSLNFHKGDYIVIPRGILYLLVFDVPARLLAIESTGAIETPERYRNRHGQLLEHSPFCERDLRTPVLQSPTDEEGEFPVRVQLVDGVQEYIYDHHPFDVVGWDGFYYPWIFNINDFEPITGRLHQPPPVHQTFQAPGFVVCSFVSRLFDYHPQAIPAPYPHSNVDSDEIIFYSWGDFMSRKGIETESITFHPMGLPHGPQPGKYEESIGKTSTEELAVMIDTFTPLKVTQAALDIDDPDYPLSWIS